MFVPKRGVEPAVAEGLERRGVEVSDRAQRPANAPATSLPPQTEPENVERLPLVSRLHNACFGSYMLVTCLCCARHRGVTAQLAGQRMFCADRYIGWLYISGMGPGGVRELILCVLSSRKTDSRPTFCECANVEDGQQMLGEDQRLLGTL